MRSWMLPAAVLASLLWPRAAFADEDDADEDAKADADDASSDDDTDKRKRRRDKDDDADDDRTSKDGGTPSLKDKKWGNGGKVPIEPHPESVSGEYRWDVHLLDFMTFSVGFLGQAGGNFLAKPDVQSINGATPEPEYPGFAGLTTGIGPTFELRFLGYFGVEVDILVQSDSGSAELEVSQINNNNIQQGKFRVEIQQDAIHVPLLFKGAIPGRIVTPVLFLGPEFVLPNAASSEITEGSIPGFHNVTYGAMMAESYTAFIFGLGLEFNLPIPYVDVRIPLNLRGTINPGLSDQRIDREGRTGTNPVSVTYSTEWQYQAVANLGLSVHF